MLDVLLACWHHLLAFGIAAVIAAELALIRPSMTVAEIRRSARIDLFYGILAALILAVGFSRAVFAAKGWAYYHHNGFFQAKMAAFVVVGLLSIVPTVRLIAWRDADRRAPGTLPSAAAIAGVRRLLWIEAAVFTLIPIFAALMARGYGQEG